MAKVILHNNYFSRLQQIEKLGKEAVAKGQTKRAEQLRKLWIETRDYIQAHDTCGRCYGHPNAFVTVFPHINNGQCLRCNGSGLVAKKGQAA
jgi:hypothetical protein